MNFRINIVLLFFFANVNIFINMCVLSTKLCALWDFINFFIIITKSKLNITHGELFNNTGHVSHIDAVL